MFIAHLLISFNDIYVLFSSSSKAFFMYTFCVLGFRF